MRFITLSSSSAGNGYLLISEIGEVLIIESGVSLMEVKKIINFNISTIQGAIVSHLHNDHAGKIGEYLGAGIAVYTNQQTAQDKGPHHNLYAIPPKKNHVIGSFTVMPFELKHDVQNYGYLINHPECGMVVFITDTHYCPYKFPGINQMLVECNYSDAIVNAKILKGSANMFVRNRVIQSHMELQTTKDFIQANDLSKVNNIVLLHLSDGNSDKVQFKKEIHELTGKSVYIAEPGLNINLNITPF